LANEIHRNISNDSILDHKLEKNEDNYFIKEKNDFIIKKPEIDKVIFSQTNQNSNEKIYKNKYTSNIYNLPRKVSNNKDLRLKIDREIYNAILNKFDNSKIDKTKNNKRLKKLSLNNQSQLKEEIISENSFKVKLEEQIKSNINNENYEEKGNNLKKFKISPHNFNSNINGYTSLIKTTEKKNNNLYNYYEILDENNKKIVIRTKVIESSQLLKNRADEEEILNFDSKNENNVLNNNEICVKELTSFKWDNFNAYIKKQEKLAKKQNKGNEPVKRLNFISVFSNAIKNQILKKIDSGKMKKAVAIFLVTILIQLILSRK